MSKSQTTIVCPSCQTYFHVSDESIGPNGRTVRCTVCQKIWFESARKCPESTHENHSAQRFAGGQKPLRNIEKLAHMPDHENIKLYKPFPQNIRNSQTAFNSKTSLRVIIAIAALLGLCGLTLCIKALTSQPPAVKFHILNPSWNTKHSGSGVELFIKGNIANIGVKPMTTPSLTATISYKDSSNSTFKSTQSIPLPHKKIPPGALSAFEHTTTLPQSILVQNVDLQVE